MTGTAVAWNAAASRYELTVDGTLAGVADVRVKGDTVTFTHTEILHAFRGRGLSKPLAAGALEDAASRYRRIVPRCPYIARYLRKHAVEGAHVEWPER